MAKSLVFVADFSEYVYVFVIYPMFAVKIEHVFFFRIAVFVGIEAEIVKVMELNFGNGASEHSGQINVACCFAYFKGVFKVFRKQLVFIVTRGVGGGEPTYEAVARIGFNFYGNACVIRQIADIEAVLGNAFAYELARTVAFYSRIDEERIVESRINGSVFGYGELGDVFVGNKRGGFAFAVVPAEEFEVNGFSACRNFNL